MTQPEKSAEQKALRWEELVACQILGTFTWVTSFPPCQQNALPLLCGEGMWPSSKTVHLTASSQYLGRKGTPVPWPCGLKLWVVLEGTKCSTGGKTESQKEPTQPPCIQGTGL